MLSLLKLNIICMYMVGEYVSMVNAIYIIEIDTSIASSH